MPELPEAETIARELDRHLAGRRLGRVVLSRLDIVHGDPKPLGTLLRGRIVQRVRRRAKRVIMDLDNGVEVVFHLGMSGRLTVAPPRQPPDKHTHLRVTVAGLNRELRFCDPRRFGGVWCLTGSDRHAGRLLGTVGVEPFEATPPVFRRILNRRRQIKALLMDQHVVAGLGNIYCDEALHAAGIHPLTRADSLNPAETACLLRAIKSTLRRAIRHGGSTVMDYRQADGTAGSFQKYHRVYQRDGESCHKCSTTIVRIRAAGRSTFLCPTCQPQTEKA